MISLLVHVPRMVHVVLVLVLVRQHGIVVVVRLVLGLPRHLVLLLEPPPGVREPRRDLGQRHLGDDGQHNLLALGRVRVLLVLVQPGLEGGRRLPSRVLATCRQIVTGPVAARREREEDGVLGL